MILVETHGRASQNNCHGRASQNNYIKNNNRQMKSFTCRFIFGEEDC